MWCRITWISNWVFERQYGCATNQRESTYAVEGNRKSVIFPRRICPICKHAVILHVATAIRCFAQHGGADAAAMDVGPYNPATTNTEPRGLLSGPDGVVRRASSLHCQPTDLVVRPALHLRSSLSIR